MATKSNRIEIRLTDEEKEKIDQQAKNENLKSATFARKVLLDYIENKNQK